MREGPIVWVVQDQKRVINGQLVSTHDTQPAEEHGHREYILDHNVRPWHSEEIVRQCNDRLGEFHADRDFVLLIGSPVSCSIAFAAALRAASLHDASHVRLLYWNSKHRGYEVIPVPARALQG